VAQSQIRRCVIAARSDSSGSGADAGGVIG
jgi:hypothetical protein